MASPNESSGASRGQYAQLEQTLIAPADSAMPATATPMIEVEAPSTLPEGYTFEAKFAEKSFTVTVPVGGVEQGQKFSIPMPGGADAMDDEMLSRVSVPVGHWRDGLCNCCAYGCCHPHFWNAMLCVPITAAQVMQRLRLTWLGHVGDESRAVGTFKTVLYIVIGYFVIDRLMGLFIFGTFFVWFRSPNEEELEDIALVFVYMRRILFWVYFSFGIYILKNTRAYVRSKYAIPETYGLPEGCEDTCLSLACSWCVAAQLARHTTDYDTYRAVCCSETGLPDHVPSIV